VRVYIYHGTIDDVLKLPPNPPKFWPRFSSPLRSLAVTARVGRVLGICFGICFITGLLSHYQYGPWHWLPEPTTPAWGYRLTQGLHILTGIATIPLLLVKLWSVYPKLFAWPPARSIVHAMERGSIAVFVFSALLEVFTGFINILDWYPWPWFFTTVHYALAYVVIGSLLLHIAVKLPLIREGLSTKLAAAPASDISPKTDSGAPNNENDDHQDDHQDGPGSGLSRRGLLVAAGAGAGVLVVATAGNTVTPLRSIALLAPRQPGKGPLRVPINRTAEQASSAKLNVPKTAMAIGYRLSIVGSKSFELSTAEIEALPAVDHVFPLACVEGWSVSARWVGPTLLSLVERAGGNSDSTVHLASIEPDGIYNNSTIFGPQLRAAILATHLNGERLTIDHGYPVRLIAPNRAGVLNTKWLKTIEVK
jgi:hypothetical protein